MGQQMRETAAGRAIWSVRPEEKGKPVTGHSLQMSGKVIEQESGLAAGNLHRMPFPFYGRRTQQIDL